MAALYHHPRRLLPQIQYNKVNRWPVEERSLRLIVGQPLLLLLFVWPTVLVVLLIHLHYSPVADALVVVPAHCLHHHHHNHHLQHHRSILGISSSSSSNRMSLWSSSSNVNANKQVASDTITDTINEAIWTQADDATNNNNDDDNNDDPERIVERSTLILLEHVNLNVPSHYPYTVPFYFDLLGCGLDPRKAENLQLPPEAAATAGVKATLWANCGASQFHFPYGITAQRIPGIIGLRYTAGTGWNDFVERCRTIITAQQQQQQELSSVVAVAATPSIVQSIEEGVNERTGRPFVRLVDHYGNVFLCRPADHNNDDASAETRTTLATHWQQPVIAATDTDRWGDLARRFGRHTTSTTTTTTNNNNTSEGIAGLEFVEFACPVGTARKIALFYESVLDATTSVLVDASRSSDDDDDDNGNDASSVVAMIAIGNVRANGRADQSLLFRETSQTIPPYDGHHIALYVGDTVADFEQAYRNADTAGVVWVNPRFSDQADTLDKARHWQQFRFRTIVDLEMGGAPILELEHELRSCQHEAWPGRSSA